MGRPCQILTLKLGKRQTFFQKGTIGTCGMKNTVVICGFSVESCRNRMILDTLFVSKKEISLALCSTVKLMVRDMLRCYAN